MKFWQMVSYMELDGADKLIYFFWKSGSLARVSPRKLAQSGSERSVFWYSRSICVAPAHDLELTCQNPVVV